MCECKIDVKLIDDFRRVVNEHFWGYYKYRVYKNANQWNCLCSAMDWVSVSVSYLSTDNILELTRDENKNSVVVYTFISVIDMMWESIQQLHRIFYETKSIPFKGKKIIFKNNPFDMCDNEYFKTIRACFGAHPVNLHDYFDKSGKREQRFASWSTSVANVKDFSVILYPKEIGKDNIILDISFQELWEFAIRNYNYLRDLILKVEELKETYYNNWKKINIEKSTDALKQIEILEAEIEKRGYDDCYGYELQRLKILFSSNIRDHGNLLIVNKYRDVLWYEINEIYHNLQNMGHEEISVECILHGQVQKKYQYAYSKLCNSVYGGTYEVALGLDELIKEISSSLYIDGEEDDYELYTLIEVYNFLQIR